MPRLLTASLASAVLLTAAMASGAEPVPDPLPQGAQVYYHKQPAGTPQTQQTQRYYYAQPQPEPQRQGFFGRLMDLERRKNQAILRFFGFR